MQPVSAASRGATCIEDHLVSNLLLIQHHLTVLVGQVMIVSHGSIDHKSALEKVTSAVS